MDADDMLHAGHHVVDVSLLQMLAIQQEEGMSRASKVSTPEKPTKVDKLEKAKREEPETPDKPTILAKGVVYSRGYHHAKAAGMAPYECRRAGHGLWQKYQTQNL